MWLTYIDIVTVEVSFRRDQTLLTTGCWGVKAVELLLGGSECR